MNKKLIIIIIFCIGVFSYFSVGLKDEQAAEDLEVVTGFGADIIKQGETKVLFIAPSSVYTFEEGEKISSSLKIGEGITPARTRENRQLSSNKQYILGLEKIYLLSESVAMDSVKTPIEIFFRNSNTNDSAYVAICHKNPTDLLRLKISGSPSSADYIEGMLKNAKYYNFFSTKYKLSDIFLNLDAEGININLPYIDEVNNEVKIMGLCILKKDKMIGKLNIEDSKVFNMLSGTDGKGLVSLLVDSDRYLDYYGKVKRSVKVYKEEKNYKYIISLKFTGDIVSDEIYTKYMNNAVIFSEIQTRLAETIKQSCVNLIDKLQTQYKVDALQLGQYAVAKYGRDKGINWDDVFSNASIEVNVKVQIDRYGRGSYSIKDIK